MKKLKLIAIVSLAVVLTAAVAGGAVWWKFGRAHAAAVHGDDAEVAAPAPKAEPGPDYKYVSLEKVLVMLRGSGGEAVSHYMAIDVVFKSLPDREKRTKEHLPLLRTVTVKALSTYTVSAAQQMTVPEFAEVLNKAYKDAYAAEQHEPPFAEALIGKLIIE